MPSPFPTPARWPALLFLLVLCLSLQACSLLPTRAADPTPGPVVTPAFTLEVIAPGPIREMLLRHLDLQRFRALPDLHGDELQRLLEAAEPNARALLGTLGYFDPGITLSVQRSPSDSAAPDAIRMTVQPGPQARVQSTDIRMTSPAPPEPAASDTARERAERSLRSTWPLPVGEPFTQQAWDAAKADGLRQLQRRRFPMARIDASRADVDADTHEVQLSVAYDPGPALQFGSLRVEGSQRYDADGARRIARLPTGAVYDEAELLDAQQRLASSGYYDAVFLTLDSAPAPADAPLSGTLQSVPVIAQVREAKLQKLVFGAGFSTDSGPRLSMDHTHNQFPGTSWRALSKLSLDKNLQQVGTGFTALPDASGWRWFSATQWQRQQTGDFDVNSFGVLGGRTKSTRNIDRSYFLQYENTRAQGINAPDDNAALSLNYGFTRRRFDSNTAPTRGHAVAVELGAGTTLRPDRDAFLRTVVRWQAFVPAGRVRGEQGASRAARLSLRAQVGAVLASSSAQLPVTQLFLTGGDTTVRGYGLRTIGARTRNNQAYGGRYLAVGSIEWQRPILRAGSLTDWESAVFVDAGAVADRASDLRARVGVGAGVRWNSPVGPLQADLAYGVQARALRLHLRLGFSF